ncbi:PD-(D/E)XK nuclease family protein [Brachybacterium sp. AOP43-C2-M15]|uniref:PD-(D/E)XK nuclease family protein n=1 Tax=Brachybacterium sp. AOP43-C2-M15 TaxID=3457661 RepID=UPI00403471D6
MRIEFGWSLDGAAWADGHGALGGARMGPRALVQLLQNRLGLTRPSVEPAVRVAQYLRLIEEHLAALPDPSAFWPARSFAVDPWSTARQLLRRRDAAVETGWRIGEAEGTLPERLATMRDLERSVRLGAAGTLSPAPADDLAEVCSLLEGEAAGWPLGIEEIVLHEAADALPGRWPHLLSLLQGAGVRCTTSEAAPGGDPALTVVEALDEWSAADAAARFLAAAPATEEGPLTVLAAADTDVLDRALHRRGLPAVGHVAPSRDRAHHQVLGLFLEVATAPVDVHQLAALLDLRVLPGADGDAEPVGLVPAAARRRLLRALGREPGIGGPAWQAALTEIAEDAGDGHEKALAAARAIDALVRDPLPVGDLRPPELSRRLDWLVERLRAVTRGEGDLLASLTQVQVLQQVLGMLDPDAPLTRRTLQQIIDSCGGSGPSPRAVREVSEWAVTTRPAHMQTMGGTVLWWGPSADDTPSAARWDPAEAKALSAGGGRVLEPSQMASLQVDAALAALRRARSVVAVLPGRRCEEVPGPSGLLAHLEAASGRARRSPESLVEGGTWSLAGRSLPVTIPPERHPAPPQELVRRIAPAPHLLPERLSYTQAAALIACPQHWTLEYALDIRPAEVAVLPTGSRMIGTLVHAVVETLVHERFDAALGGTALEAPSSTGIGEVFDRLVPQLASELDLPGRAAERADVRERAVRALGELFAGTARAGLRITGTESRFDVPLALPLAGGERTVRFRGSRDMDAVDAEGRPTVLDLKWSRSSTRYGDLHDTGEAIQLAAYAWTLAQEDPAAPPADVGYFLLRSGEFVSSDPRLDPHRRPPMDTGESWRRMVAAVTAALDEIAAGTVRAGCRELLDGAGLEVGASWSTVRSATAKARRAAREAGGLLVENHCAGSEHAPLCGLTGDRR